MFPGRQVDAVAKLLVRQGRPCAAPERGGQLSRGDDRGGGISAASTASTARVRQQQLQGEVIMIKEN